MRRVRLLASDVHAGAPRDARPTASSSVAITQDVGQAHEELDAKYEGTELTVAFNPEYLHRRHRGDHRATRSRSRPLDALKPALLRSIDSTDFLYLLMPVRVS